MLLWLFDWRQALKYYGDNILLGDSVRIMLISNWSEGDAHFIVYILTVIKHSRHIKHKMTFISNITI